MSHTMSRCSVFFYSSLVIFMTVSLGACSFVHKRNDTLATPRRQLLSEDRNASGGSTTLKDNVNAYLWRATLDTLSFMPISMADAKGGIILTDWYTPPAIHDERFKMTAFILSRYLRSDALRLSVFRQVKEGDKWVDTPPAPNTASDIAVRILSRARKLHLESNK